MIRQTCRERPPHDGADRGWDGVDRLLAVRLDAMGDVLMTTPALHAAKSSGVRHLTLLTSAAGAAAARLVPDVDEVIVYDAPWLKATAPCPDARPDRGMVQRIATMRFDAAAIFTVYSQSPLPAAMLCHLADVPLRLAHCRENPYQLLTDWVRDPEPGSGVRHEVRRQLDLVGAVGWDAPDERLRLRVPEAAEARVDALLAALDLDTDAPWAVVHPGASAPSRRYAPDRFARVVRGLAESHGWRILLTGTRDEQELLAQLRAEAPGHIVPLAGRLDLGELAALLARAPLLISNNTGPVHVAAAVGTPVVDLYALTNPQHTPWQVPSRILFHDVPCRHCQRSVCPEGHHLCLAGVPPERVIIAALELYAAARGSGVRIPPPLEAPPEPVALTASAPSGEGGAR